MIELEDSYANPGGTVDTNLSRIAGTFVAVGGVMAAAALAATRFVGPEATETTLRVEPGAVPVNVVLWLADLVLLAGLVLLVPVVARSAGRLAAVAAGALAFGWALGELPHAALDFSLIPELAAGLPEAQAAAIVWDAYDVVGPLAVFGILSLGFGMLTLGTQTMRRGTLPKLAGIALLVGPPAGFLLQWLAFAADGLRIPHAPVAVALCLAVYGLAMRNFAEPPTSTGAREPTAGPAHTPVS